ncbi:hypothetical protein PANT_8d00068 [Moesziomyces antarcticus T-34]|uniref:Uncharacterized protein n=1 Tax=Pseudozyma antarctica (strain T-34) TaxID=1151754 RepID=M9ME40_PSEA3|nr:hypothetical protein PANT_8d00068 [Moesziomyces antarcticus T-34]
MRARARHAQFGRRPNLEPEKGASAAPSIANLLHTNPVSWPAVQHTHARCNLALFFRVSLLSITTTNTTTTIASRRSFVTGTLRGPLSTNSTRPPPSTSTTTTMGEEEVGGAVPKEQRQGWGQFLKSIATFSGDLSSLTAPSFILSPVSLVEFPAYWGEHPDTLAAIATGKDEVERMTLVLKWFIGTLKGQFTARNISTGSEKKPLNPILGELFLGKWGDKNGRGETTLTAEQVSHHPPVTDYAIENATAGVTLEGHCAQKTSFSGRTISVKQVGHAVLRLKLPGSANEELYLITLPNLLIEGLWYGSPYVELTGNSYIQSTTGLLTTLSYTGKGYFSGKAHSFKATIGAGGNTLHTVEGEWAGVCKYKGKSPSGGSNEVFWDASTEREEVSVEPVEKQGAMESRNVWKTVANGIRTQDYDTASKDKARIENEQRQKRKDEAAAGTPHQLEHFVHVDDDQEYAQLAAMFKGQPAHEDAYRKKPRVH